MQISPHSTWNSFKNIVEESEANEKGCFLATQNKVEA